MTIPSMHTGGAEQSNIPDLSALSGKDLEGLVSRICSRYGRVKRVTVHAANANLSARAFALVDMSAEHEAERLAGAFRRPRLGSSVLLLLEQRPSS